MRIIIAFVKKPVFLARFHENGEKNMNSGFPSPRWEDAKPFPHFSVQYRTLGGRLFPEKWKR